MAGPQGRALTNHPFATDATKSPFRQVGAIKGCKKSSLVPHHPASSSNSFQDSHLCIRSSPNTSYAVRPKSAETPSCPPRRADGEPIGAPQHAGIPRTFGPSSSLRLLCLSSLPFAPLLAFPLLLLSACAGSADTAIHRPLCQAFYFRGTAIRHRSVPSTLFFCLLPYYLITWCLYRSTHITTR